MSMGKLKFWIVWCPFNLQLPLKTFTDEGEAIKEAKTLSKKNIGLEFYVMKSTHYVYMEDGINKAKTI